MSICLSSSARGEEAAARVSGYLADGDDGLFSLMSGSWFRVALSSSSELSPPGHFLIAPSRRSSIQISSSSYQHPLRRHSRLYGCRVYRHPSCRSRRTSPCRARGLTPRTPSMSSGPDGRPWPWLAATRDQNHTSRTSLPSVIRERVRRRRQGNDTVNRANLELDRTCRCRVVELVVQSTGGMQPQIPSTQNARQRAGCRW